MESNVKSARRVFEFLEYMAKVQRAVSVAEICNYYAYPNSSVSSVMRTMVAMGYLSYDASERTYLPAVRLPFLTSWIGTKLFHHDRVKRLMEELSDATGETILLAMQCGLRVQYVQVIEARGPLRLHADPGSFRPLAQTAVGLMLLSEYSNHKAANMIRRINAEQSDTALHVDIAELTPKWEQIRQAGYALSVGGIVPGGGALAMLLPERINGNPMSIAIGSSEVNLTANLEGWLQEMRDAIRRNYYNDSE